MATGWEPEGLSDYEVQDGEAYHRALYHDGKVDDPAEWHKESVEKLVDLSIPHISQGSLVVDYGCLLYTSPSPRDLSTSRMPSSA